MIAVRWAIGVCITAFWLMLSSRGRAAELARIVIVADSADTTIIPLLRGELSQLGLEIIEIQTRPGEDAGRELSKTTRDYRALAAFRVSVASHSVEVWIADRANGTVSLREVFSQGPESREEMRLVVLQAVELVRWSLKEPPVTAAGASVSAPRGAVSNLSQAKRDRVVFAAAPYVLLSPGGASAGAGAQFDFALRWSSVGTRVGYAQPFIPASIENGGNRAELSSRWLSIQMVWNGPRTAVLEPSFGLGAALVRTMLHGVAAPTRIPSDDRLLTVAPVADARLGIYLAAHVQLLVGVGLLVPLRSDNVVFEGKSAGTYGRAFVAPTIGIEASVP